MRDYWSHFTQLPYTRRHSIHHLLDSSGRLVEDIPWPLHCHIDGVKIYKASGANVEHICWSFSSALVKLSARRCKFWVTHVPLHLYCRDTNYFLVAAFRWILSVLRKGVTPSVGFYQEKMEGPSRAQAGIVFTKALLAGVKTDAKEKRVQHQSAIRAVTWLAARRWLPFFDLLCNYSIASCLWISRGRALRKQHDLRYTRHNGSRELCQKCCATTRGLLDYRDQSDTAHHRQTQLTHASYLHTTPRAQVSAWCSIPDYDIMLHRDCTQHILYEAGVASFVGGAVMKMLLLNGHFGLGDLDSRLERAFNIFMQGPEGKRDSHVPAPFTCRRLNLYAQRFPRFGSTYKHGQVRQFLFFTSRQAQLACTPASTVTFRFAVSCVTAFSSFIRFLDSRGAILNDVDRAAAFELGRAFRCAYTVLVRMSQQNNDCTWTMTPKAHQFDHTITHLSCCAYNPLFQFACWGEETFMGVTAPLARSVTATDRGLERALERYALWLHAEYDGVRGPMC